MARAAKVVEPAKGKAARTKATAPEADAETAVPRAAKAKGAAKPAAPSAKQAKPKAAATAAVKSKGGASKAAAPAAKPAKAPVVTLKHLAAGVAEAQDMPRREAEAFATSLISDLVEQIKGGAKVRVAGLGVIEIRDRPARMGRNPATGAPVQIAASRKIVFRPAKDLKEAV